MLDEVISSGSELTQFVNDFAGYLRNLLMAQSVDDPYSVLELSKENMELLIHESNVADSKQLIRYISILSELSNRIRYSSQKRILVEVELIKMARPETKDDYDSILDRIRVLEKKLESGSFVSNGAPVTGAGDEEAAVEPEDEEISLEELAKALPEDIVKIGEHWDSIVSAVNSKDKLAGTILMSASTIEENGKLIVLLKNPLDLIAMQKKKEVNGEEQPSRENLLKQTIGSLTGLATEIEIRNGVLEKKDTSH